MDEEIKRKTLEEPTPYKTAECSSEAASTDSCRSTCCQFLVPKELKSKCRNRYSYNQLTIVSDRYRVRS